MDLIVTLQSGKRRGLPSSITSHCFVSLPSAVAESLAVLEPFASLVVVRLVLRKRLEAKPIYVVWAGATEQTPDKIGFHPNLAFALDLREGDVVTASVVERVSFNPRRKVDVAYLRPASYDQCEVDQPSPESFDSATQHFTCLNATANVLENSVLSQVRLLYTGLVIPLQLPANECIYVRVKSMDASGDNQLSYALLVPSSRLSIEPPPPRPEQSSQKNNEKVFGFFRVIPMTKAELGGMSPLFRTHAILPGEISTAARYAYVSRKDTEDKSIAIPLPFVCHENIPQRHIWVPTHVCQVLGITPFAPVLFEEVAEFPYGDGDLLTATDSLSKDLAAFADLIEQCGVYYNGMPLRGLRVHTTGKLELPAENEYGLTWDRRDLKTPDREDDTFYGLESIAFDECLSKESLLKAASKRHFVNGFRSFPEQAHRLIEHAHNDNPMRIIRKKDMLSILLESEKMGETALAKASESSRRVVHEAMKQARIVFTRREIKVNRARVIVIQGAIGVGKTHICTVIASLLRDLALVRTVWVRCKVHSKEDISTSIERIRASFRGAMDGGPGLIVLDDIDNWAGMRDATPGDGAHLEPKDLSSRRISQVLEREITKKRNENVLVLLTCKEFVRLHDIMRCPGLVDNVLYVRLPEKADRAFLFRVGLKDLADLDICESQTKWNVIQKDLVALVDEAAGFSPLDIFASIRQGLLRARSRELGGAKPRGIIPELLNSVKSLVPVNRIGIKFLDPNTQEKQSWSNIGGLLKAKHELWEALQQPSLHPDVFKEAPLRLPHGILLFGPPGCGKTMLAKIAAAESKMRCIVVRGPELLSKYVGESEAEVRRAFARAAQATPCALLFDEFDALAPRRGGYGTGVSDRVVNTLLACMDGAERLAEGVYVLATTSRPEIIDPALLRPGRLDKWICVDIPADSEERLDILWCLYRNYFDEMADTEDVLKEIAGQTDGYTGADLGSIINDANIAVSKHKKVSGGSADVNKMISMGLKQALSKSRPTLSRSQRLKYRRVMSRFSAFDKPAETDASRYRNLVALK
ncbi:Cell division cycle protein 48-like [Gracilariopsis chorda]|uniref:Peroxisomal ATPase PEX1 n=1 Tax=Gracilariopsis chorda TaxID=448386 RepID=A0A2V3IXS9_9FLOR|nr:Cell division cycle protein 48-like [Gracilariopsis chorda]|eukprot:PXF46956.1 Cell division cycle protein 48-like [Gracilariopsis chorda]